MEINDLKEIMEPSARYVFLDDTGITEACQIHLVEKNTILLNPNRRTLKESRRKGYFVASDGRGIVRWEGSLVFFDPHNKKIPSPLYRLDLNLSSLTLVNRREFLRKELPVPLPVTFEFEKRLFRALLVNLSEGGMRLSVAEPLPTQTIFRFELNLPGTKNGDLNFSTDGLVVYCEPENDPSRFMTGVSFVAPNFSNDAERKTYVSKREQLAEYIRKDYG